MKKWNFILSAFFRTFSMNFAIFRRNVDEIFRGVRSFKKERKKKGKGWLVLKAGQQHRGFSRSRPAVCCNHSKNWIFHTLPVGENFSMFVFFMFFLGLLLNPRVEKKRKNKKNNFFSWILTEFWPKSDVKSSNGSIGRRSNLSTLANGEVSMLKPGVITVREGGNKEVDC